MPIRGIPSLVLATGNPHKAKELSLLLAPTEIPLRSLADFPGVSAVAENGGNLRENACLKAGGYARQLNRWVLADDTGLEVTALHGAPGVHSARYAGDRATREENCRKLLDDLRGIAPERRQARFVCHLALANPQGEIVVETEGVCTGSIRDTPRGEGGIGYDSLFEVQGLNLRLAELTWEQTLEVGHRGRAVDILLRKLTNLCEPRKKIENLGQ